MRLQGKKIGVLIEGDFTRRKSSITNIASRKKALSCISCLRLWGQTSLTF